MNKNEKADIPGRLRRLRPVAAPPQFSAILYGKIRALGPRNRYLAWFTRPMPVALIVATGALLAAAYFLSPYHLSPSSPANGDGTVRLPIDAPSDRPPGPNLPDEAQVHAPPAHDSSSADSGAVQRNDVNTSKLP